MVATGTPAWSPPWHGNLMAVVWQPCVTTRQPRCVIGMATLLALSLVFWLSLRMRREEMRTLFLLGSSRLTMLRLILAESLLLGLASLALGFFWVRLAQRGLDESTLRFLMH